MDVLPFKAKQVDRERELDTHLAQCVPLRLGQSAIAMQELS